MMTASSAVGQQGISGNCCYCLKTKEEERVKACLETVREKKRRESGGESWDYD